MTLGLLGLASGGFIMVFQPYDLLFKLKVVFSEGGEIFELWRSPPVELYLKVYLFNVTNSEEFMLGKEEKLKFQEVGPYVYRELMEHGNVTFNDNGTVTAVPLHPLTYIPEMSTGTESDMIIVPNIALLSIANIWKDAAFLTRFPIKVFIEQSGYPPLVKMTAREFMFEYESPLVALGNYLVPSWIKFKKLGLIDRMYDFEGDYETVYTGENDVRQAGLIEKYNGDVNLPQWEGKCANVKGASDGTKFPSYIQPNDTLLFFRKSLCRSARMYQTGEKQVKGLNTYKYKFIESELDNGANNTENKCFCRHGLCQKPGLIDVTDCYYGFPIALSYPHFYKSDPSLLDAVEGLTPRADDHESYFFIQPESGLPVDLAFRFQINIAPQDIGYINGLENFQNTVLPLLWFEIGMYELPENMNNRFLLYLNVLPVVQTVATYALFLSGAVFLVWSVIKILLHEPKGAKAPAQWFEAEMQRKRLSFLNERRASIKTKEMDTYFNSLLNPKEDNLTSVTLEDLQCLKKEIV
ncbi:scavenger receptor class B member 1 isoform X2 [Cephus cinctus]|nr:scavenger receptor class B member 1 isoform X2 [Cephus cinctus]